VSKIHGHDGALQRLKETMSNGRMHHAWIISGPMGVGKRLVAEETARILLDPDCDSDDLGKPTHSSSHQSGLLEAGTHPDLHVVHRKLAATSSVATLRDRKQMNIPVDLLRETVIGGRTSDGKVHEAAAYRTPMLAGGKVFIIDEAERLDLPGQNLLLKTLEEPPGSTWFFLVTSRPDGLLPTIWSRCQHLPLAPLSHDAMVTWVASRHPDVSSDELDDLIAFSDGSPGLFDLGVRRSLGAWIQSVLSMTNELDRGAWTEAMAASMGSHIESWSKQVLDENPRASKASANQEGAEMILRMLSGSIRRQLRSASEVDHLLELCDRVDRVTDLERQISAGLNLKHALEAMTAEWAPSR